MTRIQVPLQTGSVSRTVNRLRLVVVALLLGVVSFAAVAVFLVEKGSVETSPELAAPMLVVLAALVAGAIVGWGFLRRALIARLESSGEGKKERLLAAFVTLTIVGAAMAEGIALFATVIHLLTASPVALVAVAAAAFALVRQAPSEEGVRRVAERIGISPPV